MKDYLDDQLGQVPREEEISPSVTPQPDVLSEPIHVDAECQTTVAKIEKEAKQQRKILSSPPVGRERSDLIVDGRSVEMGELKESLEASLAEIERLKTENKFREGNRAPSRRTIPDLSLDRDSAKAKDRTTSCGISIAHKKTTASVKDRSTQTELTDPSAQQLHDLGVQLQYRTCQMKLLAAREDQALNRQHALEQHLNALRSDLEALRWQIQGTDQAFQQNEILTSQLSTQARDMEQARRQLAASQQHEEEPEMLPGKIEGEVSTNQESDQIQGL